MKIDEIQQQLCDAGRKTYHKWDANTDWLMAHSDNLIAVAKALEKLIESSRCCCNLVAAFSECNHCIAVKVLEELEK